MCFLSAQYKVWVKPGAEQSFLYGNHVLKSGLGRITENTTQYQGVIVYSMADVPLVSPRCVFSVGSDEKYFLEGSRVMECWWGGVQV